VGRDRIEWISHDSYYRNFDALTPEERAKINFDHPDSLESELLTRHLDVLAKGSSVEVPVYDFATHSRKVETQRVEPRKVIIVEGILVLAEPELRKRIDIKLFVDTPADIRFLFHAGKIEAAAAAFRAHVDEHAADALAELEAELEHGPRTALLCLEADPATCHRRVLTDALQARRPDLRVVDL